MTNELPEMRASDSERERVAELLREAVAEGRIDMEEFDTRLDAAYKARTHGELQPLVRDLPAPGSTTDLAPAADSGAVGSRWASRGMTWVLPEAPVSYGPPGTSARAAPVPLAEEFRTAWRSPVAPRSPGADLPLQTTGARRRAAPPPPPLIAGIRAVSAVARAGLGRWLDASFTRKLAWFTMTCAGSQSTLTMLSGGCSSNPGRGVLVSTLI
ncbi:DUF1707 domain-containing protein [Streptomyces niveus]|uniref:DUF1707 SHOCT-like domain-containing protein n=1 Tax=Streptomyces niveus TaxID=193462 RepID=UPI00343E0407